MSVNYATEASPVLHAKPAGDFTAALAVIVAIIVLHYETLWSMIVIWSRSQTFAHGFVIVPISAWMIWRERSHLVELEPRPSATALVLLAILGVAWLLASLVRAPVVAQYAVVAMIPSTIIVTLGWDIALSIAFPLTYLLLAVPFGEVFIPYLIDFTASFTVGALQLTGVPVFQEHNYFIIPSGTWSVVDACSGLRYLIASLALGSLYAQLNYRSLRRRLIFVSIALLLPILANGVRAYLIVMIGHWSNMQLAVGIDHLIYGWVFFGLVSLLLFWCASLWPEPPLVVAPLATRVIVIAPKARLSQNCAAVASILIVACGPLLVALLPDAPTRPPVAKLDMAPPVAPWAVAPTDEPHPSSTSMPYQFRQSYRGPNGTVFLQLAWYPTQFENAEMLIREPYPFGEHWRVISNDSKSIVIGKRRLYILQTILKNERRYQLVWHWFQQGGIDTNSALLVKLLLAKGKLLHTAQDHADIIVAAPFDEQSTMAEHAMSDFLTQMLPAIEKGLRDAAKR